jgi:hypothetical protein
MGHIKLSAKQVLTPELTPLRVSCAMPALPPVLDLARVVYAMQAPLQRKVGAHVDRVLPALSLRYPKVVRAELVHLEPCLKSRQRCVTLVLEVLLVQIT